MRKCFITIQFPAGAFRAPFPFENGGRPSLEDTATTTTTKTGIMVMMMLRFCGPCCCGVTEMQLEVKGEKKNTKWQSPGVVCDGGKVLLPFPVALLLFLVELFARGGKGVRWSMGI